MATSGDISERLALIARDVQSGKGVGEVTNEICAAATELISGAADAGVSLVLRGRRIETACATADLVRIGDELQYELDEGPCLDAAWREEQVYAGDLAVDDRWPIWGPRVAEELGVRSMLCTQLFTNEDQLGALNVYSTERHAFDRADRDVARLLAAHAAVGIAAAQEIETLKIAVDRRTTIGKALGIIMARYGLDDEQAFAVLRRFSSHQNRKLYDVATEVVRGLRLPDA